MASPDFGVFENWGSKGSLRPAASAAPAPDFSVFDDWGAKRQLRPWENLRSAVNPNIGVDGFSAEGRAARSALSGGAPAAPAAPGLRAGGLSRTLLNGSSVYDAGASASKAAMRAGAKMAKPALGVAGSALGVLPHAAAYADDAIPFTDKAKLAGTDVLRMGGTALGGLFGAGFGSVIPIAGTVAGGAVGGYYGDKAGEAAGNAVFGGDEVLRKHGYSPERSIIDSISNKDGRGFFGGEGGAVPALPSATPSQQSAAPSASPTQAAASIPTPTQTTPASAAAQGGDAPSASPTQAAASIPTPTQTTPASAAAQGGDPNEGKIIKNGNSYSGTNIPAGAGMVDASGAPVAQRGGFVGNGGGSGSAPRSGDAATTANDNMIRAANLRDGVDVNRGTSMDTGSKVFIGADTGGFGLLDKNYLRGRSLRMDTTDTKSNMEGAAGYRARIAGAAGALQEHEKELSEAPRVAAERQSKEGIARTNNEAAAKVHQMQNQTALRGQDMAFAGQRLTAEQQARQNALQLRTEDRKYLHEQRQYEAERGDKTFTQRQAADKALNDKILQMHTANGEDGKPMVDQNAANATLAGVDTMIARQIDDLKKSGTPADLARAKNLADNGAHALSPDALEKAVRAVKLMNKVNSNSSKFNPLKPDPLVSSDPRDYFDMARHNSGDFVTKTGQRIPARFLDTQDNAYWFGTPTNEFDLLKGKR